MPYCVCSAEDALLGIVSIYQAGQIYMGQRIKARKCGYSEQGIRGRTYSYTGLSKVRAYLECPTLNIDTIQNPTLYEILLCLEHVETYQQPFRSHFQWSIIWGSGIPKLEGVFFRSISLKSNKLFYASRDFNLNVLDYNKNGKVTKFLNLTFEQGFVPVKLYTKNTVTPIDHIITNSLLHRKINTGILKLDISDHFPIFLIAKTEKKMTPEGKVQITKRLINNKTKEKLKK